MYLKKKKRRSRVIDGGKPVLDVAVQRQRGSELMSPRVVFVWGSFLREQASLCWLVKISTLSTC